MAPVASDRVIAPMEDEDADLVEADDEMQDENEEDAGFDVVENVTLDVYQRQRQECEAKKLEIIESNWCVTMKSGNSELVWTAVPDSIPENPPQEFSSIGVRNINWDRFNNLSSIIKFSKKDAEIPQPFLELFLLLWPGDWKQQLAQLNEEILKEYRTKSKNKVGVRPIRPVTQREFFVFIGIIIFSGAVGKGGKNLFEKEQDRRKEGVFRLSPSIDLTPHMPMRRFEDIKTYLPYAFADFEKRNPALPNHDPWYMLSKLIDEFNKNRGKMIAASVIKLLDELMSAWCPRKSKTGGLPNISFILRKPEPLGTEFKSMACSETGK
jgi:hypothetical protein